MLIVLIQDSSCHGQIYFNTHTQISHQYQGLSNIDPEIFKSLCS